MSDKRKILLLDALHPVFQQRAEAIGFQCEDGASLNKQQTLAKIGNYEGIAVRSKFCIDQEIIDQAKKLRFIARAGAGMDNIDETYAKQCGIVCMNASEGNRDAVAEHAIGMLLSLMNHHNQADQQVRQGRWDREGNRGVELRGRKVAIIGYGNTGQAFVRKIKGFDVEILAYDKYKTDFSDQFVQEVSMEQVVKQADVLSLHIPLTRETRQLIDKEYLFHFKKPIFFINTARGEIVNTQALLDAIENGKILGAGLDVLEVEGFPALSEAPWYAELVSNRRVLLSPHIAGWTMESYRKISEVLADKLERFSSETSTDTRA